jgi:hypothetical protein
MNKKISYYLQDPNDISKGKFIDENINVPDNIKGDGYEISFDMEGVKCPCGCLPNKEDYELTAYIRYSIKKANEMHDKHKSFNWLDEIRKKVTDNGIKNERNITVLSLLDL